MQNNHCDRWLIINTVLLFSSAVLCLSGCAAVKKEFFSQPVVTTNSQGTLSFTVTNPPITDQLRAAAPIVEASMPAPWGTLVAALMNLVATGCAAFATFHARSAAVASRDAVSPPS